MGNNDIKVKMKVVQAFILKNVLNEYSRSRKGLRDLWMEQKILNKIDAVIPSPIPAPVFSPSSDGEKYTEEEKQKHSEEIKKWNEAQMSLGEVVVDLEFLSTEKGLIRNRLEKYQGFVSDGSLRGEILGLAEMFGCM